MCPTDVIRFNQVRGFVRVKTLPRTNAKNAEIRIDMSTAKRSNMHRKKKMCVRKKRSRRIFYSLSISIRKITDHKIIINEKNINVYHLIKKNNSLETSRIVCYYIFSFRVLFHPETPNLKSKRVCSITYRKLNTV